MWLACDLEKAYLPLPVFLNRLAADRLVLIFGISVSPVKIDACGIDRMKGGDECCPHKKVMARAMNISEPTPT